MDGGLSESCSALLLWRQSWQILAWPYTSGESFSVCLAEGSGWQRARGGLTLCVIFLFEAEGTAQTPNSTFFGSCCKGWPTVVFGMDVITLRFIRGLEIQRRSISSKRVLLS